MWSFRTSRPTLFKSLLTGEIDDKRGGDGDDDIRLVSNSPSVGRNKNKISNFRLRFYLYQLFIRIMSQFFNLSKICNNLKSKTKINIFLSIAKNSSFILNLKW